MWASGKLCGVEQRAPPIFGRAAITFGIGPHSRILRESYAEETSNATTPPRQYQAGLTPSNSTHDQNVIVVSDVSTRSEDVFVSSVLRRATSII